MDNKQDNLALFRQVFLEHIAFLSVSMYAFACLCFVILLLVVPIGYGGVQLLFYLTDVHEVESIEMHKLMAQIFMLGFSCKLLIRSFGDVNVHTKAATEYLRMRKKQVDHLLDE